MSEIISQRKHWSSLVGFAFGIASLLLVVFHFGAGPLDPQPTIGQSIGEIAADIRDSALNSLKGEEATAPRAAPWSWDRILQTSAALFAGIAIVLGLVGYILKENRRLAFGAVGIGTAAIGFQFFIWLVMVAAGVIILGFILQNLGDIIPGG